MLTLSKPPNILQNMRKKSSIILTKICLIQVNCWDWSGSKDCTSCRSLEKCWRMNTNTSIYLANIRTSPKYKYELSIVRALLHVQSEMSADRSPRACAAATRNSALARIGARFPPALVALALPSPRISSQVNNFCFFVVASNIFWNTMIPKKII